MPALPECAFKLALSNVDTPVSSQWVQIGWSATELGAGLVYQSQEV